MMKMQCPVDLRGFYLKRRFKHDEEFTYWRGNMAQVIQTRALKTNYQMWSQLFYLPILAFFGEQE